MSDQPRLDAIQQLAAQLRRIERNQPTRASDKLISTGLAVLDDLLPEGGIHSGSIIEWLSPSQASGAGTLAFLIAAHQIHDDGALIVVDSQSNFYPPALANFGIDFDRLIIIRPNNMKDTLWSLEQALRCPGVAVVICRLDDLDNRTFRRLQLAAETGGSLGLLLRSDRFREQPSWAKARFRVSGHRSAFPPFSSPSPYERLLQLELLRCRNNCENKTILIGICDETGSVRLVSELVTAASLPRAVRA